MDTRSKEKWKVALLYFFVWELLATNGNAIFGLFLIN